MTGSIETTIEERYQKAARQVDGINGSINEIRSICSRSNLVLGRIKKLRTAVRRIENELQGELHRAGLSVERPSE